MAPLRDGALEGQRQTGVLSSSQREHEGLQRLELLLRWQSKIDSGYAVQRLWKVLDDRAHRKGAQRAITRRAIARPPGARTLGAVHRGPQSEHVGDATQDELVLQVVKAIQILENEAELSHQLRLLEVLPQVRIELGHKERVVVRERRNECGAQAKVVLGAMAGATGAAVPVERLPKEDPLPLGDERLCGIGRGR